MLVLVAVVTCLWAFLAAIRLGYCDVPGVLALRLGNDISRL